MKKNAAIVTGVIVSLLAIGLTTLVAPDKTAADADENDRKHGRVFGLWQGVQASDGSIATFSVRDLDSDGVLEVTYHEFWFGICGGDRGVVNGTFVPLDRNRFQYDRTVVCPTLGTERFVSGEVAYHPKTDLLVLGTGVFADTFHRISRR